MLPGPMHVWGGDGQQMGRVHVGLGVRGHSGVILRGGRDGTGRDGTVRVTCVSSGGVTAEEGVEHGQLHALLVAAAPGDHRALAVGRVQVMAVARERQAARAQGEAMEVTSATKKHFSLSN